MRLLILSDIHSNRQALDAVIAAAAGQYDRILCLGDVVGYGADPNAVTDWVREHVALTIRGNHDRACSGDSCVEDFSEDAQAAAMWTKPVLTPENREFLAALPQGPALVDHFALVHGSPRDEDEYLFTRVDAFAASRYMPTGICFFGHTHVQGAFAIRPGRIWTLAGDETHELETDTSYLINPGSVGQPRDGDPRAAWAIFDTDASTVAFHRVAYNVAAAQKSIRAAKLPANLANRLALGY